MSTGLSVYNGQVLHVDLSTRSHKARKIPAAVYKHLLGGKGLGAWLLLDLIDPKIDPYSPENPAMFMTGPVTGLPFFSKTIFLTKSPLTNGYLDSFSGGFMGSQLKAAGYDGLIITGKAEKPQWLEIYDDQVRYHSAESLWGKSTSETEAEIRKDLGGSCDAAIASIGIGGEKKVRYANIMNRGRSFGRGGGGAVLGSKNLKGIAIQGTHSIRMADIPRFFEVRERFVKPMLQDPRGGGMRTYGTLSGVDINNEKGALPSYNNRDGYFPGASTLGGTYFLQNGWFIKNTACEGCPLACGKMIVAKEGQFKGVINEGPEYETTYSFAASCGSRDGSLTIMADKLCDEFGIDTITAGSTIAFSIECAERGLIGSELNHGTLTWGDAEGIISALEMIAHREGIGDSMAEGTKRMSEKLGGDAMEFAMHSKGMETSGWDPRSLKGMALEYITSDRGGDHNRGGTQAVDTPGEVVTPEKAKIKGEFLVGNQNLVAAIGSMIVCRFSMFFEASTADFYADLASAATGWKISGSDLLTIGERAYNLSSYFNHLAGLNRETDTLAKRLYTTPHTQGITKGSVLTRQEIEMMQDVYYKTRKWDLVTGRPTLKRLNELEIPLPPSIAPKKSPAREAA